MAVPGVDLSRIIPARAGFTAHERERSCPGSDHPRSRGVYAFTWRMQTSPVGSSPLARGLRLRVRDRRAEHGIIPARAGFTRWGSVGKPSATDHPRSRGVYPKLHIRGSEALGSSPLARSLPVPIFSIVVRSRIIPARAGFTRWGSVGKPSATDHPRSRGVYLTVSVVTASYAGSSPLARGLRCAGHEL